MRWLLLAVVACSKSAPKRDDAAIAARPIDAVQIDAIAIDAARPVIALDRYEVTVAEYRACVDANACPRTSRGEEMYGKNPKVAMSGASFYDARAYCAWKGKRLPTPAEWKHAAYGDDARKFPWGDEPVTCERAWFDDCQPHGMAAPGGRAKGASAAGNEDMLGNASEWTDPGPINFASACVGPLRKEVPLLGGDYVTEANGLPFQRDYPYENQPTWVDNPSQGFRCADAAPITPPPSTDAVLTAKTWNVIAVKTATAAIEEVAARCKRGEQATYLFHDNQWLVAGTAPSDRAIEVPALVRVVGRATCNDVEERTRLTAKVGKQTWRMRLPSALGIYQLWLAPGSVVTLEIECTPPPPRGECSWGTMITSPQTFRVPMGPMSGVEGPALEGNGGVTCD